MNRKYRIMICDDSEKERLRFYTRQYENFEILGVIKEEKRFVEIDPIDSVDKLYRRIMSMREEDNLPDLVLLDLFYKKPLANVDQMEKEFVSDLLEFKKNFQRLKGKVLDHLEATGITALQRIREIDQISAVELPIAVYTDKNFNFLPNEQFNLLYRLDAGTVHKDRDDPVSQITPAAEYMRILHAIESNRRIPTSKNKVFISHGKSNEWLKLQSFLDEKLGRSSIELAQSVNLGHTVITKLRAAADQCSYAVIVMTGDDRTAEGQVRARENVMHEVGYFQGKLGLDRVVLLAEENVNMPSNLSGIVYLPFPKSDIATVFDSLAKELVY